MAGPCETCGEDTCYCQCQEQGLRDWACFAYGHGGACENEEPGCAVGCRICFDNAGTKPDHVGGVTTNGERWARPAQIIHRPRFMTRDAWGWVSPLRSNHTTLLTRDTLYQVAQCYDRRGGECFEERERLGVCKCTFEYGTVCDENFECLTPGDADGHTFPDCVWFHGLGVPHKPPLTIDCRHCGDTSIRWFSPTFGLVNGSRMGNLAETRSASCASNVMVACIGAVPRRERCCPPDEKVIYYVTGQQAQLFSTFELDWSARSQRPRFHRPDDASEQSKAAIDIRNAALAYIRNNANRLPHGPDSSCALLFHDLPLAGGKAASLDTWVGGCTEEGCAERIIYDLPNSHLRFSGFPVKASVVLESVGILVSFFLHSLGSAQRRVQLLRPGGRIDIDVKLAVRCEFDGEPPKGLEWIDQGCNRNRIDDGLDEVVLVNADGVQVQVPYVFKWRGGRTEWTMQQFPEHHPDENEDFCDGGETRNECCRYASQITLENGCRGTRWEGMPSRYPDSPTTRNNAQLEADIWAGGIHLRVPLHKFEDWCDRSCARGVRQRCR